MKTEKKELIIFLLVTFGTPFLMGIPLSILHSAGKDTSVFASTQMFYPAAGFMLAKLIYTKDKNLLPKQFFIGFLILTFTMFSWCFTSFLLPHATVVMGNTTLLTLGSIIIGILYLTVTNEKLNDWGLKSKNLKSSIIILLLFIILYFFRAFISLALYGESLALAQTLQQLPYLLLLLILNFPITFTAFLGEEYGWRYYFQPLLQNKFGLIKGVFVFGVLWGLWHLPLNLFYYDSPSTFLGILFQQITCISLGAFFAFAYMKTNNIWLPILLHYFNNNLSVLFMNNESSAEAEYTLGMIALIILINFGIFLPFLSSKVFKTEKWAVL